MLRVGTVPYFVGRPLDAGLEREPGIEVCRRVPADLVAGLRSGDLDVALVSSIELFRQPGYSFLDGIGVSGRGMVSSVQVFLKKPRNEVRTVALDPSSRTAATLVRVVWPVTDRTRPVFLEVEPGEDPRLREADAWLRIGDPALRECHAPDAPPTLNPSEEWARLTGLPFVFAAWVAAPGVSVAPWAPAFARARARGAARIESLAREAASALEVPEAAMVRYFGEEVLYDPGEAMRPALREFRDRAAALGLCRGDLDPAAVRVPVPDLAR